MILRKTRFVAFGLAVAFAGCGGGAHSSLPAGSTAAQNGKVRATFHIDYPKNATTANKRSARYISPATTQIVVDIQQDGSSINGYPATFPLTPTAVGCTATLADLYCNLSLFIPPGSYTATLTTEDANAAPLSSAQAVPITVTNGGANQVSITLSGIPASLQVSSAAYAVHGPTPSGFVLYGSSAQQMIVTALDADGNVIVGQGAPMYATGLQTGSGWTPGTPSPQTPNLFAITPPGVNNAGATFSVTANYTDGTCSLAGAVCTTTFAVKNDIQTLFVANGTGSVTLFAPPYSGAGTTITSGVSNPSWLLLDGAGDIFVSNHSNSSVTEYASPYSALLASITTGVDTPYGIALDPGGDLFVANFNPGTGSVTVYARPYSGSPTTITNGVNIPYALTVDGSGNVFVANQGNNTVTVYAPPYSSAPTATITTGVQNPYALALDGAGNLFVANRNNSTVTMYAPPYTGAPATIASGVTNPQALLLDAAGNLFVANEGGNTVTEYAPPYSGSPTTTATGVSQPWALALDGAGNLFVANYGNNSVTMYVPPYTGAPTTTITTGIDEPYAVLLTP